MQSNSPLRLGIAGLGGYAAFVSERLIDEAASSRPAAQLVAACEPHPEQFLARVEHLQQRGARLFATFEQLLDAPIDAVWLPLPIDLHRPYTELALRAGKAVLCEKPAAGSVDDVDAMIAARDAAGLPVAVGFQDAYQPAVADVKRRILAGDFGAPVGVRVLGCWPRNERYFARNTWAGRLRRDGRWILDGPATNALAHFLHLPLLLLGPTLQDAIYPTDVAAELYRVNDIESYDTCSLRFTLPGGVPMTVAYTHACVKSVEPVVTMQFERATLRYLAAQQLEIHHHRTGADGGGSRISPDGDGDGRGDGRGAASAASSSTEVHRLSANPHHHMLGVFQRWVRQRDSGALGATLESARAHVVAINAAVEATPIYDVPPAFTETLAGRDHSPIRTIRGIVPALQRSVAQEQLLHESGQAPWGREPGRRGQIEGYGHFAGPAQPPPSQRDGRGPMPRPPVRVTTSERVAGASRPTTASAASTFPQALRPR